MLKVGLTGGIAAGKSAVGEMFAALGAQVIQADEIAHQLMQPGQRFTRKSWLISAPGFWIQMAVSTGPGWRKSPSAAQTIRPGWQELNQIVHPAVIRRQEEWMEQIGQRDPHAVAMVEAALILEADMAKLSTGWW